VTAGTGSGAMAALRRNPLAIAGMLVLLLLVVLGVLGPWIAPYGINEVDIDKMLQGPNTTHWFGTDELGRDVLSRVIYGARVSLVVAVVSVGLALVLGVSIGLFAGYHKGVIDNVLMRCMDVLFAFPVLLLAVAIVAVLGPGLVTAMIAIGVVYAPIFARVTRASVLSVREQVYVRAAISIGASDVRIMRRHVLPNIAAPLIVQTSLSLAFAILSEAALSFLGLGDPTRISWGTMLENAFESGAPSAGAWWYVIPPGLCITFLVLAVAMLGYLLEEFVNPRLRDDG
jgi:peptide/nickel transport system permease protein